MAAAVGQGPRNSSEGSDAGRIQIHADSIMVSGAFDPSELPNDEFPPFPPSQVASSTVGLEAFGRSGELVRGNAGNIEIVANSVVASKQGRIVQTNCW